MEILVFKTNVTNKKQVKPFRSKLDSVGKWNFDLEDIDKIFRIETKDGKAKEIEQLFVNHGFVCIELE